MSALNRAHPHKSRNGSIARQGTARLALTQPAASRAAWFAGARSAHWEAADSTHSLERDATHAACHCRRRFPGHALKRVCYSSHHCRVARLGAGVHLAAHHRFPRTPGADRHWGFSLGSRLQRWSRSVSNGHDARQRRRARAVSAKLRVAIAPRSSAEVRLPPRRLLQASVYEFDRELRGNAISAPDVASGSGAPGARDRFRIARQRGLLGGGERGRWGDHVPTQC